MNLSVLDARAVAAVIPAFNEGAAIGQVVQALQPYARAIVVDDGSSDETALVARRAGAEVVSHAVNQGYDRALETGLRKAIELGFEFAVTMDGDGQHYPDTLRLFMDELLRGADLVVGVRDRRQRFAESLFCVVSQALWKIKDPLCGMKGYRLSLVSRAGQFDSYTSIGTELTLRAARSQCRITQIPIRTRERSGTSRFGAGFRANWRILRAMAIGLIIAKPFPSSN